MQSRTELPMKEGGRAVSRIAPIPDTRDKGDWKIGHILLFLKHTFHLIPKQALKVCEGGKCEYVKCKQQYLSANYMSLLQRNPSREVKQTT